MKRGSARARPRVRVRLRSGLGLGVGFGRGKAGAALARSQGRSRRGPGYVDWGWASALGSVVESATAEWSGFPQLVHRGGDQGVPERAAARQRREFWRPV